ADFLRLLIGDLDLESLFKRHDQFNRVQRIGAEVIHERSFGRYLALVHAQLLHNDLLYAFLYGSHEVSNLLSVRSGGGENSALSLAGLSGYFLILACWSMYVTASCTVRIFSASSSGISISKASSKAMTSSTVSSESAPRSSTNEALGVTSASSTPNCSTMICFTFSSTANAAIEPSPVAHLAQRKLVSLLARGNLCKERLLLQGTPRYSRRPEDRDIRCPIHPKRWTLARSTQVVSVLKLR